MKILVANRGEIAVRILRACREMGVPSVAVYSECDRTAPHVRHADEAVAIGPSPAAESYLDIDRVLAAAAGTGATAVHPGYGFLAENAAFARACRAAGLAFIGPDAGVIETMGGKTAARQAAIDAGVPVVPGTEALPDTLSEAGLRARADEVGYPLFIKAVAGGGGRGMRRVAGPDGVAAGVESARSEAGAAFGESAVYFERLLERARHIEVQVLCDEHGTVIPFVERECSIQRRHQKVIEESPSVAVTGPIRTALAEAAAALCSAVRYVNAGTLEFLLDENGRFYFLEMNTRLQVEHPVTEMVTGVDLVHWQIRIARGERLTLDPGRALAEYEIGGITTAIPALLWILEQDVFAAGDFDTAYLDRVLAERRGRSFSELPDEDVDVAVAAAALLGYLSGPDRPAGGESAGPTPWRRAARLEGLRR